VLDHTAIMTVIRRKRLENKVAATSWRKTFERLTIGFTAPERRYGMGIGAVMLTAMFILAGGGIPYLPWIGVPVIGAVLGLITAAYAEKISPVAGEEVMAGEALGMSLDEVMREIVIPNGRPGLMQKLNQRKVKFK
jgi:ABC-type amino acid transport system permease subunit